MTRKKPGELISTPIENLDTASQYDFVRPYFNDPITLQSELTLDLNNATLHVNTGEYKLNLIEMCTDEFADAGDAEEGYVRGYITVDNEDNVNTVVRVPATGNQYITVPVGETKDGHTKYAAHRVQVDIDSVSIKPATVGMYYTTNMDTTPTASKFAVSYGVVLSLLDVPGTDFIDGNNGELYTKIRVAEFADGKRVEVRGANSALLTDILPEVTLEQNGKTVTSDTAKIYANAYICFDINGVEHYVMADKTRDLSLQDIMKLVDADENLAGRDSVLKMYENWQDPMAAWAEEGLLPNIKAAYGA